MAPIVLIARSLLRRQWRSYLAIALLVGLGGSAALAGFAAARRTVSAYPTYLRNARVSDLSIIVGAYEPELAAEFAGLPEVLPGGSASYAQINVAPVGADGQFDRGFPIGEQVGSIDGRYLVQDRVAVTRGRVPRLDREDEILLNEVLFAECRCDIGHVFTLGIAPADRGDNPGQGFEAEPLRILRARVVGVGLLPNEIIQDDIDRVPRIVFTPALTRASLASTNYGWQGLRLRGGAAAADAMEQKLTKLAQEAGLEGALVRKQYVTTDKVQRAVRPVGVSLGAFAAIVAIALLVLTGLAISRQFMFEAADSATLRSMGVSPVGRAAPGSIVATLAVGLGLAVAVAGAFALSPIAPVGRVRKVDVDAGWAFDATALVGGAAMLGAVLVALVLAIAVRSLRRPAAFTQTDPTAVASAATRLGASAAMGLRMAVEPGRGPTSVPVRINLVTLTTAVLLMVAALTFSDSLTRLVDRPELYGTAWDGLIAADGGYGALPVDEIAPALDAEPTVDGWATAGFGRLRIGGVGAPAIGFTPGRGNVSPPLLRGRLPTADDEVVLGQATLEQANSRLGGRVRMEGNKEARSMTVVGVAVLPAMGPVFAEHTSPGSGALVTTSALRALDGGPQSAPSMLMLRLRGDADAEREVPRIAERLPRGADTGPYDGGTEQRPADITNASAMGRAPATLAAMLAVTAVVALALTVGVSARRRRRDLAVMKALGFTRRQLAATVAWQATVSMGAAVVIGSGLGVVLGRSLWRLFAQQLDVVPTPSVPVLLIAAIGSALIIAANGVAAPVAWVAGRVPASTVLRAE